MIIHSLFSPSMLSNIYMVHNDRNELIIIDPAEITEEMILYIEEKGLDLKGVLLTHLDKDHIAGLLTLEKIYTFPFYSFRKAEESISIKVNPGEEFPIGSFSILPIQILGHSDDSIVYKIENALFTGDTLYAGKIGSTDSYLKKEMLKKEINEKLMIFEDNTLIFPGHGPTSKIRIEKFFNIDLITSEASYL